MTSHVNTFQEILMALLTLGSISRTGLVLAPVAAAAGGDTMPNGGQEFLYIKNGSGSSINVTAAITQQVDGVTPAGKVLAVAAGAEALFGPFSPAQYNDSSGRVAFSYSAVTDVTVQALQLVKVS